MNPKRVRKAEQVELIMECRSSGLSDYQWCQNHDIHPGTFYNWVSKLRKVGYAIPDSQSRISAVPVKQEVVKLEMSKSAEYSRAAEPPVRCGESHLSGLT